MKTRRIRNELFNVVRRWISYQDRAQPTYKDESAARCDCTRAGPKPCGEVRELPRTSQCDNGYIDRVGNRGNQTCVVTVSLAIPVDILKNNFTRPGLLDRFGMSDRILVCQGTSAVESHAPIVVNLTAVDARR